MYKRNPEPLKNCLKNFKNSWRDFDNLYSLTQNWGNIVGKDLAKECKPLKIEKDVLTIVSNHPQWRQALIYNRNKLKETINNSGIFLKNIRIIQNYQEDNLGDKYSNSKLAWDNHPSRVKNNELISCKLCDRPTPKGEIERWGKCTFCWRINK